MNINLSTPCNNLGYGIVGINILKSLVMLEHNISLFPIGPIQHSVQEDLQIIKQAIHNQAQFSVKGPSLRIYHQFDLAQHVGDGLKCGFPFFEVNSFSEREKYHLKTQDIVFVASKWAQKIVKKEINKNSYVVPLGVDSNIFKPVLVQNEPSNCCFLNIGKYSINKGSDFLLTAFNMAFEKEDNVSLTLVCQNPFFTENENNQWNNAFKKSKLGNKINILPRVNTQYELAQIMNLANIGVFLSRGEAANLEVLEMMACGKNIIATNYSGHTEYLNNNNAYLIEIDKLESSYDGRWFFGNSKWASLGESQLEQTVEHMRNLYKKWKEDFQSLTNLHGMATAQKYTWENSVKILVSHLETINERS